MPDNKNVSSTHNSTRNNESARSVGSEQTSVSPGNKSSKAKLDAYTPPPQKKSD